MRLFHILNKDGVSVLLEGVEFEDGRTVAQFRGQNGSLVVHDDIEQLSFFHAKKGTGRTLVWLDAASSRPLIDKESLRSAFREALGVKVTP